MNFMKSCSYSRRLCSSLERKLSNVLTSAISPDDQWLVSGNDLGTLGLLHIPSLLGCCDDIRMISLPAHDGPLFDVAFLKDSVITAGDDGVKVWSSASLQKYCEAATAGGVGDEGRRSSKRPRRQGTPSLRRPPSPQSAFRVSASAPAWSSCVRVSTTMKHQGYQACGDAMPKGRDVSEDTTGRRIAQDSDKAFFSEVNAVVSDEKANHVLAAAGNGCVYLWDVEVEKVVRVYEAKGAGMAMSLAIAPNANEVLSGHLNGCVCAWDSRDANCVAVVWPFSPDAKEPKLTDEKSSSGRWVGCMSVDDGGNFALCGGGPSKLSALHIPTRTPLFSLNTPTYTNTIAPHGDELLSGGGDGCVRRWSRSGESCGLLDLNTEGVYAIATSPNVELFAIAQTNNEVTLLQDPYTRLLSLPLERADENI
eukprot:Rmarinus@m.2209